MISDNALICTGLLITVLFVATASLVVAVAFRWSLGSSGYEADNYWTLEWFQEAVSETFDAKRQAIATSERFAKVTEPGCTSSRKRGLTRKLAERFYL